ncbi:MAG: class I SAM-dependent methyltransferase [Chlamydiota bacterium]
MHGFSSTPPAAEHVSYEHATSSFQMAKQEIINKIERRGDLPYASIEKQLELLEKLGEFALGRFLIEKRVLDGYWTHYVVTHPLHGRITGLNHNQEPLHPLEVFLLDEAPSALATQERFSLFKDEIKKHIHEGCSFASIPSGLMAELLDLDYSHVQSFTLHGIDLDPETLSQAQTYAEEKGLTAHSYFSEQDAWKLDLSEEFDLIASNGLTIYEPNDDRVIALYMQFYGALKPGGVLITSFVTPPPAPGLTTEWDLKYVSQQNTLLQKIILVDLLEAKWQIFRKEETVKAQLHRAGFKEIEILYDKAHIFPTVIAKKK